MKARLLLRDQDFDVAAGPPAQADDLASDLDLPTLLGAMAAGDKFIYEISRKVLLAGLTDPEAIRYRQEILADCIAEPDTVRALYGIAVGALEDKRGVWGLYSSQNPGSILSSAVSQLEVLIARLRQLRRLAGEHGGRFRSAGMTAFFGTIVTELDDDYFALLGRHLRQLRFRDGALLSAQLAADNSGTGYVLRASAVRRGWRERAGLAPRSTYSFTIHPRDDAGALALAELTSRGINSVANAAAQSADHIASYFTLLRAELGFYVGCLNLRGELAARDLPMTFPDPAPLAGQDLTCADLRDVGLALRIDHVVGNDVAADGVPLVIITGANSGGKTTFLRSLGLALLMMQAGLFVTASAFRASVCHGVFTHFSREEDAAMVSGRLDEELARMSAIADRVGLGSLVLFNESFAATNEREGSEIGRQVATALIEAGIRVVFVTHHFDLADGFHRQQAHPVLFLRAPRRPDGTRDFRLAAAAPLPTSYGADIYQRIGGWLGEQSRPASGTADGEQSRPASGTAETAESSRAST